MFTQKKKREIFIDGDRWFVDEDYISEAHTKSAADNFAMDFGMFSDIGNQEVVNIVRTSNWNYDKALLKLKELSKKEGFEEASDNVVIKKVSIYFDNNKKFD